MLESEGIEVVGEASDGAEAVSLVEELLPDLVLIDVVMPNQDGIETTRILKERWPHLGVVVLSGHDEQRFVFDALKAGASAYLLKTADLDQVVSTIRAVAGGRAVIDPDTAEKILDEFVDYQESDAADVYQPLTRREREILISISDGLPDKAIAETLEISTRTVTTHAANIYSKLQVNNRVTAVQEGIRRRILNPTS